jgi:small conductance mechanosensitive channel
VNISGKAILLVGFIVALSMLEVNIGPLLAAIGAAGFIVGFALQGTLSNFAAGIMILIYRPYDVGDMVDVAGTFGTVDAMTIVSTTLRKPDNQKVVVPNNMIWGDIITNITGTSKRRVDLVFGIGYTDDIAKAQKILEEILASHESILKNPEPVVKVHELADSSVNFVVRPWVETDNYWDVYWDITRAVKERFDAEGVSIPFPQRDVHVHQLSTA